MDDSQDIYITEDEFRRRYEYKSSDLLGEGGFAQVYKAYDKQFNEFVALKFYNKGEKGKYDVLHEMKDSRGFSHKNIIRVHDAFVVRCEQAGIYSYVQIGVLEYANGGNLRDFIDTKPPEGKFIKVLTEILEGLKYLHSEKGIIHRDLSPENILMYLDGEKWIPKISDFGISKKLDFVSTAVDQKKSTQLLGKIEYMAPEQFYPEKFGIGGKISTNVDLWAFGIILYELFMHRTPFGDKTGDNPVSAIQSITNDSVHNIGDIPYPYRKVIERCLVKEAWKRVKNAEELISILTINEGQLKVKSRKTIPIEELKKKTVNLKWAGISLGAVILIIGGYLAIEKLSGPTSMKSANETDSVMKHEKYSVKLNELSNKTKSVPAISELDLDKKNRIQIIRDSISVFLAKKQFSGAKIFYEKLPEDLKSDSELKLLYRQSSISLAALTLNNLIQNKDFKKGKEYFKELKDPVKKNPEIVRLYKKIISSIAIDSLIKEGNSYYENKNYDKAESSFKLVIANYDSKNYVADSMIKRIDVLISSVGPDKNTNPPTKDCLQQYSGSNLKVGESPDPMKIKLLSICLTVSKMNITLEIQPLKDPVTIHNPLSNDAFYIEFDNGSQQLKLKDVRGVITNRKLINPKATKVELEFDRLPKDVKTFNLMEGKNQKDTNQQYWNFKGIRLVE
ncbi:MAG: serine/threonine-protein kinase [Bacteroidales bacterium]|jgi:serine/threonine protein kinase